MVMDRGHLHGVLWHFCWRVYGAEHACESPRAIVGWPWVATSCFVSVCRAHCVFLSLLNLGKSRETQAEAWRRSQNTGWTAGHEERSLPEIEATAPRMFAILYSQTKIGRKPWAATEKRRDRSRTNGGGAATGWQLHCTTSQKKEKQPPSANMPQQFVNKRNIKVKQLCFLISFLPCKGLPVCIGQGQPSVPRPVADVQCWWMNVFSLIFLLKGGWHRKRLSVAWGLEQFWPLRSMWVPWRLAGLPQVGLFLVAFANCLSFRFCTWDRTWKFKRVGDEGETTCIQEKEERTPPKMKTTCHTCLQPGVHKHRAAGNNERQQKFKNLVKKYWRIL